MTIVCDFPVIDAKKTGANIKKLCVEGNYSARDLQTYFNLENPQAIYSWWNGTNVPNADNLLAPSRILGVSMNDIVVCCVRKSDTNKAA